MATLTQLNANKGTAHKDDSRLSATQLEREILKVELLIKHQGRMTLQDAQELERLQSQRSNYVE